MHLLKRSPMETCNHRACRMNFLTLQNQIFNLSVSFEIISFATHIIFALLIVFVHLPTVTLTIAAAAGKPLQLWCVVIQSQRFKHFKRQKRPITNTTRTE